MPLVRDCSCRGDSAGFAYLSCLTKYAEQKCKQAHEVDYAAFREPWKLCNNCKQPFQNQLAIDLSSACVSFTATTYGHEGNSKWDKLKVLTAHRMKLEALDSVNEVHKTERTMLINNMLSIINQTKKDLNMSRWIHMPKASEEYQYYRILCGNYEALAHMQIGMNLSSDTSEEGKNVVIGHFKKARAIYNLVDMKIEAQRMEDIISVYIANMQATNQQSVSPAVASSVLQTIKSTYEQYLNTQGMNSECTIDSGLAYAIFLRSANRHIEAERLAIKVATVSRRVFGPEHKYSVEADELLKKCRKRYVFVPPDDKRFQALRYENDGEICVVTGPVTEPRIKDEERIHRVESNRIVPAGRCPVICHGLVSASHLNGELGVARDVKKSGTGIRIAVHFEKKGTKPSLVKPENLRIAFELPIISEE